MTSWHKSCIKQINLAFTMEVMQKPQNWRACLSCRTDAAFRRVELLPQDDRAQLTDMVTKRHHQKEYTAYRLWHTALTGIYGKRGYPVQLWFPAEN